MHPRIEKAAPERFPLSNAGSISKSPLVYFGNFLLILRCCQISVAIEHISGIWRVCLPSAAPRQPDVPRAVDARIPSLQITAGDLRPVRIAAAEIGKPLGISRVIQFPFSTSRMIGLEALAGNHHGLTRRTGIARKLCTQQQRRSRKLPGRIRMEHGSFPADDEG